MNIVIDFETYYDKNITLKKLNYSEYIPQAKPLLVTLNDETYADAHIGPTLAQIDWSTITLVGHNLMFDALVLKHWYGHQAAYHKDTLCMARYLHPSVKHDLGSLQREFLPNAPTKQHDSLLDIKGLTWDAMTDAQRLTLTTYNKNDVNLTRALYDLFIPNMPKEELQLIDWTIKLWLNPTLILDKRKCIQAINEEYDRITEMLNTFGLNADTVRSSAKFYAHLVAAGLDPPTKISPKTGKTMPAFAKTDYIFKDFCEENNIMELYELKQSANSNIKTSRAETMLRTAAVNNGKIPVAYNYHGAFTGRFSGGNKINLQNLPRGGTLRYALQAPEGYSLVACDLSQIEARVLAWLAEEDKILDAFIAKKDLYCEVASKIFNKPITKANPDERFVGKAAVLGLGYGMGKEKFQLYCRNMGRTLSTAFCTQIVNSFRRTYSKIPQLWNYFGNNIHTMAHQEIISAPNEGFGAKLPSSDKIQFAYEKLILPSGRALHYRNLAVAGGNMWRMEGGRTIYAPMLVENAVQAISYDILKESILALKNDWNIVLTTHDEIVICCQTEQADEAKHALLTTMCTPPQWGLDIPLNAEAAIGKNYGECK